MNNEQRERLVEILNKIRGEEVALADYEADVLIDHLIENNVVVLPCKVGDVVYRIEDIRDGQALVKTLRGVKNEQIH